MNALLRCRVPFAEGETLVGYASRLAACNRVSLPEFCRDLGLDLRGIVGGSEAALEKLGFLSGTEPGLLATGAIRSLNKNRCTLLGQEMRKGWLRRRSLIICPRCLGRDVAGAHHDVIELPWDRMAWCISGIDTCLVHGVALRHVQGDLPDDQAYDFSARIAPHLHELPRWSEEACERRPTGFEAYLNDRLNGVPGTAPLLDAMPFHAAHLACMRVGTLMEFGIRKGYRGLEPEDRRRAEASGFECLQQGAGGFVRVLDRFRCEVKAGRKHKERPQVALGRFWQWLSSKKTDAAFDPLRDIAAEHVQETYPLDEGAIVLGRTVDRRRWHSITSAAQEVGLTKRRTRTILAAAGLLPVDHERNADALVLIDAEKARSALAPGGDLIATPKVAARLGVSRETLDDLLASGALPTSARPRSGGLSRRLYEASDVDVLVERMFAGAVELTSPPKDALDLPACAARVGFTLAVVIDLLLEDETMWRGLLPCDGVVDRLVVKVDEVRTRLRKVGTLTAKALIPRLRLTPKAVAWLLDEGLIRSCPRPTPLYGRPTREVSEDDVAAFCAEYASLGTLAQERGGSLGATRYWLASAGVEPALPLASHDNAIYRRADLPPSGDPVPDTALMSAKEVAKQLKMNWRSVISLIQAGIISATSMPNPNSGKPMIGVSGPSLTAFEAEFTFPGELAREHHTNVHSIEAWLADEGITPIRTGDDHPTAVYRRRDIPCSRAKLAPAHDLLGTDEVVRRTGLQRKAVLFLLAGGFIPSRIVARPVSGKPSRVVEERDMQAFLSEYATPATLARERGTHATAIRRWLKGIDVEPALPTAVCGSPIYRRSELLGWSLVAMTSRSGLEAGRPTNVTTPLLVQDDGER